MTNQTHSDLSFLDDLLAEIASTAKAKNHDYNDGSVEWWGNFKHYGLFGLMSRWHDKVQRAENLLVRCKPGAVRSESIKDTLLDLATYSLLILGAYEAGIPMYGDFERGERL